MSVEQFLAEAVARLEAGAPEIHVEAARVRRELMTHDEIADTARFNDLIRAS